MANQKKTRMARFLNGVERIGNKLPDPFILFILLAALVAVASWVISLFDVTFVVPGDEAEELAIKSILSAEGIQYILSDTLENFVGFAPLGIVLTMMLGIGLADKVGLIETGIKSTILKAPRSLVTYAIVLTGILGNIASDAAFVIIPPLAAMVFYNLGRHPLAGLAAGFAGVGAGFTSNLIVTGTDALLAGISTEAIRTVNENLSVTPVDNWYFMMACTFILTFVGGFITEKIVEPRLGKYEGNAGEEVKETTSLEMKGLRNSVIACVIFVALLVTAILIPNSPLTGEDGSIVPSPFLTGIVPILLLFFVVAGVTYGVTVGKIKSSRDVGSFMGEAMKDMSGFIVLVFAASQFIAYFSWTNMGAWIAISGAEFLQSIGMTGIIVILAFVLFTAILNLFVFSGSAQWALEAPIFVPMFYYLGYSPAFVQAAYRIADSSTNVITPMNPYMIIVLGFVRQYDKKAGLGTIIALMLPYTIFFLITFTIMLLIFYYTGIPFGPGVDVHV